MKQKEIFENWKKYFFNHKLILKQLNKIDNENLVEIGFFNHLNFSNNRIYGKIDVGYNAINELSVNRLVYALLKLANLNNKKNNTLILSSDGKQRSISLIKNIARINTEKVQFITFNDFIGFDEKITMLVAKKVQPIACIHIQHSMFDSRVMEIIFLDSNGQRIENKEIEAILDKSIQYSGFEIPINDEYKLKFLDEELIVNIFSEKIIQLYTKNILTSKTKITISNHNQGVTNILSKLVSKLDYSYIINNKPKTKLNFYAKILNESQIKKMYRDEINFAKKRNSNLLISFDSTGTQLYLFAIYKNQTYFLNENLITLIFLHDFFNNLQLENKKIKNFYLSSNINISKPLENLFKKYDILFTLQEDNNIKLNDEKYMFYYWNIYQQFSFGEIKNKCYSIYHICLKMLEIINYQNLQYNTIKPLLNNLSKMYEVDSETKIILNYEWDEANSKILKFIKNNEQNSNFQLVYKNNEEQPIEEKLIYIFQFNDYSIIIKYNYIFKKIIIILRRKTTSNTINYLVSSFQAKLFIKKYLGFSLKRK